MDLPTLQDLAIWLNGDDNWGIMNYKNKIAARKDLPYVLKRLTLGPEDIGDLLDMIDTDLCSTKSLIGMLRKPLLELNDPEVDAILAAIDL